MEGRGKMSRLQRQSWKRCRLVDDRKSTLGTHTFGMEKRKDDASTGDKEEKKKMKSTSTKRFWVRV
jgi:hypothetical protein